MSLARAKGIGALGLLLASAMMPATAATLYVRVGTLVDTENGVVQRDRLIRIEDDTIVAVSAYTLPPKGAMVVDWSAYTVLPGLIDMHVHLADADETSNVAEPLLHSTAEIALLGARHARETLDAGFTSVHDVGCFRAFADVVVPDDMRVGVLDAADVTRKVAYLFQHGADSIKLIATGAVLAAGTEPGQEELTEEEMHAAVLAAAAHGGWVTAHAHGAAGIKSAMRAGVRAIEHASLIDDEGIAMAKAKGVYLDMDIYNGDYIDQEGRKDGWPADILRKNLDTTEAQRQGFRKAVKAGVKLTFGTDAGVYPHGKNARQFKYMVKYGMSPMQAIQAATVTSAALLGWSEHVGAISAGHYADLIAVSKNPIADISALENVDHVMKGGALVR